MLMAVASLTSKVPGVEERAERSEKGVTSDERGRRAGQSLLLSSSGLAIPSLRACWPERLCCLVGGLGEPCGAEVLEVARERFLDT